ncbi:exported hypothetical protein [Hyphomicrobium sp. GJ21]|nr:exported hypothetical protein [Hyphomicrobium sp. GJ21]
MKLTASGVAICVGIMRSPSFSRSSASTRMTMRRAGDFAAPCRDRQAVRNSDPVASGLIEVAVRQTPLQQIDNPASSGRRTWAVHMTNLPADLDVTSPTSVFNPVNIA